MAICQIMIRDFMYGWGGLGEGYDKSDLEIGIQYAKDLIEFEKLSNEPFHGYDLRKFMEWCQKQLKKLREKKVNS